jgi:hypothetical protein
MTADIELRSPVNSLVSFHYWSNANIADFHRLGLRLIGDSGAFSAMSLGAPVNIDRFIEWGVKWQKNLCWIASLDAIGDTAQSWKNYKYIRGAGLDAVPTIHYGTEPSELDRYADEGVDFVGLGGMVGRKSERQRLMRWTLGVFRYARDNHPGMRFHGWGATHNDLVMSLPWYSVDSSGFTSAYRFGRLSLFNPATAKMVTAEMNGQDIYRHADLVRREYKINPALIAESTPATRRLLVRTSVKSVQKLEDFLRARHKVKPPVYGLNSNLGFARKDLVSAAGVHVVPNSSVDIRYLETVGPNVHFVDAAAQHLKMAAEPSNNKEETK